MPEEFILNFSFCILNYLYGIFWPIQRLRIQKKASRDRASFYPRARSQHSFVHRSRTQYTELYRQLRRSRDISYLCDDRYCFSDRKSESTSGHGWCEKHSSDTPVWWHDGDSRSDTIRSGIRFASHPKRSSDAECDISTIHRPRSEYGYPHILSRVTHTRASHHQYLWHILSSVRHEIWAVQPRKRTILVWAILLFFW